MKITLTLMLAFSLSSAAFGATCVVKQGHTYTQVACPPQTTAKSPAPVATPRPSVVSGSAPDSICPVIVAGVIRRVPCSSVHPAIVTRGYRYDPVLSARMNAEKRKAIAEMQAGR